MLVLSKDKQNWQAFKVIHQEKKERTQINKIRNQRGKNTTDTTEIQRIIRNYYEQIYAKKFQNLGKMDKFLDIYDPPKLSQEEAQSLNKLISAS